MSNSTAQVSSDIEGGRITLTYETDPAYVDGLTQDEIVSAAVGLIPALIYAATYGTFNAADSAMTLREFASLWEPQDETQYVSSRSLTDREDVLIETSPISYSNWARDRADAPEWDD